MDLVTPRHRSGAAHHDQRNGSVVELTPIKEISTQTQPMSEKQAIALIVLLSLGLWTLIWGVVLAIHDVLGFLL